MESDSASTPLGRMVRRHAWQPVVDALTDTRVVLVQGARQSGKSTLVRQVAEQRDLRFLTLDNEATRRAAAFDPVGFVAQPGSMVIDEIQRVPELLLAIKERVDVDQRPGQFLLTGSARVLGLRTVADTLPGRIETIELYPFSQGEIAGRPDGFVDAAFTHGAALDHRCDLQRADYTELIVRGGFPEAVTRVDAGRRARFLDSYVEDLVTREVSQLAEIERLTQLRALVRLLAARSGQMLRPTALGNEVALPHSTVSRYLELLELLFLIKRIPAWSRNLSRRATSAPKVAFVDSGVAADLLGLGAAALATIGSPLGPLLEGFVLMELSRQLTWATQRVELYHYRSRDQLEVDAVLEDRRGRVIGIEVKAAATVRADDFRGLRYLADLLGDDFLAGFVLYTGPSTLPFGDKFRAVPVGVLWEVGTA